MCANGEYPYGSYGHPSSEYHSSYTGYGNEKRRRKYDPYRGSSSGWDSHSKFPPSRKSKTNWGSHSVKVEPQVHLDTNTSRIANRILQALRKSSKLENTDQEEVPSYSIFLDPENETLSPTFTERHTSELKFELWKEYAVIHIPSAKDISENFHKALDSLSMMLSSEKPFSETIVTTADKVREDLLKAEFRELQRGRHRPRRSSAQNKIKGMDANRIVLNDQLYIATSNPGYRKDKFWEMVVENNSSLVVKLTDHGADYFPDKVGEKRSFQSGQLQIEVLSQEKLSEKISVRKLKIETPKEEHIVTHIDFRAWPDFSVPKEPDFLILMAAVKRAIIEVEDKSPTPITVHCGAGWGRTGTFITIHSSQHLEDPDYPEIVQSLRDQRTPNMVEKPEQYVFINDMKKFF